MQNNIIKTKRLILRLIEKDDIQQLSALESDPEVRRFFPSGTKTLQQTEATVTKFIAFYKERGLPNFVIFEQNSGDFVGRAGFGWREEGDIEVGYLLHKKFWGKGLASELLAALLVWAKDHINADYITGHADSDNLASIRVMEKCGMSCYKEEPESGVPCKFYRIQNR